MYFESSCYNKLFVSLICFNNPPPGYILNLTGVLPTKHFLFLLLPSFKFKSSRTDHDCVQYI